MNTIISQEKIEEELIERIESWRCRICHADFSDKELAIEHVRQPDPPQRVDIGTRLPTFEVESTYIEGRTIRNKITHIRMYICRDTNGGTFKMGEKRLLEAIDRTSRTAVTKKFVNLTARSRIEVALESMKQLNGIFQRRIRCTYQFRLKDERKWNSYSTCSELNPSIISLESCLLFFFEEIWLVSNKNGISHYIEMVLNAIQQLNDEEVQDGRPAFLKEEEDNG